MKRLLRLLLIKLPLAYIAISVSLVVALKWAPVVYTPLMLKRSIQFGSDPSYKTGKIWIPASAMAPAARKCVIASEDNRFATHHGFDFDEMEKMAEGRRSGKGKLRGCSTISQQTAKNVFTFCGRTWLRKAVEAYHTVLIEAIWGKERIMEVYLNVAEMGKGIYGVEAASEQYFGVHASALTTSRAALLAAALPNPLKRNPARPSSYMLKRQKAIMSLVPKLEYPEWVCRPPEKKR